MFRSMSDLYNSFVCVKSPPKVDKELNVDDFELVEKYPAYSLPISDLEYDKTNPGLGNSTHKIIKGVDTANKANVYIKFNDNQAMLYAESFLNLLYSMSLLYGVARCYVRYDDEYGIPKVLSSEAIPDFETFKKNKLTAKHLSNPTYRHRFLEILAVMKRIQEDDGHAGNITNHSIDQNDKPSYPLRTSKPTIFDILDKCLILYDADCAFWKITYKIKGGRQFVDTGPTPLRNPETAFDLYEEDVIAFPNGTRAYIWYSPVQNANTAALLSNNPFTPEETKLVREMNDPEALNIFFTESMDWMLDLSQRFRYLAGLIIPSKYEHNAKNMIESYCETNRTIDNEYWTMLPKLLPFHDFLTKSYLNVAREILIRCEIRNLRLEKDKKIFKGHDEQFDKAKLSLDLVIKKMNELIKLNLSNRIMLWSMCPNSDQSGLCQTIQLKENPSTLFACQNSQLKEINKETANKLIENAKLIAKEMIVMEEQYGTEKWATLALKRKEVEEKVNNNANQYVCNLIM